MHPLAAFSICLEELPVSRFASEEMVILPELENLSLEF
jgi:hypothetical protein